MRKLKLIAWLLLFAMLLSFAVSCREAVGTTDETSSAETTDTADTTASGSGDETPDSTASSSSSGNTARPSGDLTDGLPEEMPVFHIDTNGVPITSKEVYIPGTLTIGNTEEAYALSEAELEIRGRGNYSWSGTEKKSYRIKFTEKVNLLGQGNGPARSWTLLAVHCDQSMLRTAAAFKLARSLSGIGYTSSVSFAKVYLNGEFLGVYQVSEQMQVQDYRVNVDDSMSEEDEIGFLVELDTQASELPVSDGFNKYEIKSEIYTVGQYEFIQMTLEDAFYAVWDGNEAVIDELIDIDSMVDTYIVEEVMKNLDAGWGSFYMYRDIGGKLHFGPVWDFDLSAGNADTDDRDPYFPTPEYLYVGTDYYQYSQQHRWFVMLMQQEWFYKRVEARWNEITEELAALPAYVRAVAALYSEEFDENFERWPIFGQKINREPMEVRMLKSHDEHAEYLALWLEERIAWLDKYFKGEVDADPDGTVSDFEGSGGNGTRSDPYLVSSAKDFYELTLAMMYGTTFDGQYFLQTANIDMVGYPGYNGIGAEGSFGGVYNANGYAINAEIAGDDECIFPYVTGTVMNLITTGSVTNLQQAAGIARSVRRDGKIVNCLSAMAVTSTGQNAGGIVASNQSGGGTVSGCVFVGTLSAAESAGAINVFMENRGGVFTHNYYLASSAGTSFGSETAVSDDELATLHDRLNASLTALSGGASTDQLCRWSRGDGGYPVMEHR